VQQVVCNLVGNAMKFTPPGGRITIAARAEGDEVQVPVKDTGAGMSEADLERIFEPYWQAQRTASLGAGLGLKIAKGISSPSARGTGPLTTRSRRRVPLRLPGPRG